MSNKPCASFRVQFVGDGTSNTIEIQVSSDPIIYEAGTNSLLSPLFHAAALGVQGVYEQSSQLTVTGVVFTALTQKFIVTFSSPPSDGAVYTLLGVLIF